MKYKEAFNSLKVSSLTEEEKGLVTSVLSKKTKQKLIFSLVLFLSLLIVSIIFILLKAGRFTPLYLQVIFVIFLLTVTLTTIVFYYYYKDNKDNFNFYFKLYRGFDLTIYLIIIVSLFLFIQMFIIKIAAVKQNSMNPTLSENDKVFVLQCPQSYYLGDIVVVSTRLIDNYSEDSYYVKRIMGVPNSSITYLEISESKIILIIDDYEEEVTNPKYITNIKKIVSETNGVIPEGMYFLLGDNTANSIDSRLFGLVREEALIGKVKYRFYPNGGKLK